MKDINNRFYKKIENIDEPKSSRASISKKIDASQLYRASQDIRKWRAALSCAENIQYPQRTELIKIHRDSLLDAHLLAQIKIRKNSILSQKFFIENENKTKNDELTELLKTEWFQSFVDISLNSIFFGFELVEFGPIVENSFTSICSIKEEYVVPEWSIVKKSLYSQNKKLDINFTKSPHNKWTIGIGSKDDLGLLNSAAPILIRKKSVYDNWSSAAQVFGMPLRVGRTSITDPERKKQLELSLKNMGAASWAILDNDDSIEMIQSSKSDIYLIYQKMIELCNQEISKLINGVILGDEKSFVGSSMVSERLHSHFSLSDKRMIVNIVNNQLIPFLKMHKIFPEQNVQFKYDYDDRSTIQEAVDTIDKLTTAGYVFNNEQVSSKIGFTVEKKDINENNNLND